MRSGQPEVRAVIQGMCDEVRGYQEATVMTGEAGLGEAAVVCVACVCMCLRDPRIQSSRLLLPSWLDPWSDVRLGLSHDVGGAFDKRAL